MVPIPNRPVFTTVIPRALTRFTVVHSSEEAIPFSEAGRSNP